jgi:SAM-dependent methyltransferase
MHLDIDDLRKFYTRPLGSVARRLLAHRIRSRWRHADGLTVIGLGFVPPYLGAFRGEAARLGALMPAHQGAVAWPGSGPGHSVMVEGEMLPLPDNSIDRLLAVHCLESSGRARQLLREIWRVLAPEGRLLLVTPNRRGVWARLDTTPFGHGQPYSRAQLERLLTECLFTPLDWSAALYMPPVHRAPFVRWAPMFERAGSVLWPGFAGVIIVEARKELMAPIAKTVTTLRTRELATARSLSILRAPSGRRARSR